MSWPGTLAPSLEPDVGRASPRLSATRGSGLLSCQTLPVLERSCSDYETLGGSKGGNHQGEDRPGHLIHKRVPDHDENASIANVMFAIRLRDFFLITLERTSLCFTKLGFFNFF